MSNTRCSIAFSAVGATLVVAAGFVCAQPRDPDPAEMIRQKLCALESARDPKCYATASRLENMVFGVPLSEEARFRSFDLQKQLAALTWRQAGRLAKAQGRARIDEVTANALTARYYTQTRKADAGRVFHLADKSTRTIPQVPFEHCSSHSGKSAVQRFSINEKDEFVNP